MDGKGVFSGLRVALPGASDFDAAARLMRLEGAELHRFSVDALNSGPLPLESWMVELFDGAFDDVVFFTAQSVRLVVEFSRQLDREVAAMAALRSARKISQGPKAAAALKEFGLRSDVTAPLATAESLVGAFSTLDLRGRVQEGAHLTEASMTESPPGTRRKPTDS